MNPAFICLKYKSVKSPLHILNDNVGFGWKCRKYQRWKDVHVDDEDKNTLKAFGDALIDQDDLRLEYFGRISEIFLNVQRWRHDKENLAVDPPHEQLWDQIDSVISLGDDGLSFVKRHLAVINSSIDETDSRFARAVVIAELILSLASEQGLLTRSEDEKDRESVYCSEAAWLPYAQHHITTMYAAVGVALPESHTTTDLLQSVCRDLGLSEYHEISRKSLTSIAVTDVTKKVVIHRGRLPKQKLLAIGHVQGVVVVTLNDNHSFVSEIFAEEHSRRLFHQLVYAYARSANDLVGAADSIEQFTSYLGLTLSRVVDGVDTDYRFEISDCIESESP